MNKIKQYLTGFTSICNPYLIEKHDKFLNISIARFTDHRVAFIFGLSYSGTIRMLPSGPIYHLGNCLKIGANCEVMVFDNFVMIINQRDELSRENGAIDGLAMLSELDRIGGYE